MPETLMAKSKCSNLLARQTKGGFYILLTFIVSADKMASEFVFILPAKYAVALVVGVVKRLTVHRWQRVPLFSSSLCGQL